MPATRRQFIRRSAVLAGAAFCWPGGLGAAAEIAAPKQEGSASGPGDLRLDLAPFGYEFRAGRRTGNPPETRWLVGPGEDILAGVLWEEHRPVQQVEVVFANRAPDPARLRLEITTNTPTAKQENRPTWWTRQYEVFPGPAMPDADGVRIRFQVDRATLVQRLCEYPSTFQYEADPHGLVLVDKIRLRYLGAGPQPVVVALRAYGLVTLRALQVEVEWGFNPGRNRAYDGRLEIYNGRLGPLAPVAPRGGVVVTGPSTWRSAVSARGRRGITAELWWVPDDAQTVRFRPSVDLPAGSDGTLVYHPNRTAVTVQTKAGSFTFAPRDLVDGEPILVPSLGFFVAVAGQGWTADRWQQKLAADNRRTVRQRLRQMPEQTLQRALEDHYSPRRPAYPAPEYEAPMGIAVPDELAAHAWRLAYSQVRRRCLPQGDNYLFYIWPYRALLGQESWRLFQALDLLGEHAVTRAGFTPWFQAQGRFMVRGLFAGPTGALNVDGWDLNHAQGHGSMLFALAQHYALSGDQAWLQAHLEQIKAACEWILRQRAQWLEKTGPDCWISGLIPPCELGDYADWRSLYQTNFFFWRGLKCAAEAVAVLEPSAGARYLREAELLRQAVRRAVARSVALAPVLRVQDGTCRRNLPPQPYVRGMCDQITNPFGGAHAGSLVMDSDLGAAALGLGLLPGDDAGMEEMLDVLEDRLYHDNWVVRLHRQTRRPDDPAAWFSIGGYYYQCGYSTSALAHLYRDDVPAFLRAMFNQYAADVDPDHAYQFREHPNRTGEGNGGDKTFEVAAFLERMRAMLVMEEEGNLWLARATPRAWLEQGKKIAVRNAPSHFGVVAYEIVSAADQGRIAAQLNLRGRGRAPVVLLRLRHPGARKLRRVEVNGKSWPHFDPGRELIRLPAFQGNASIVARYHE